MYTVTNRFGREILETEDLTEAVILAYQTDGRVFDWNYDEIQF